MARTRAELAARLREGYEANNWGPALDVLGELEAPEAAPVVEAESCGDPVLGKGAIAEGAEHEDEDVRPEGGDEDDPFGGGGSGFPDRVGEDGEEHPGLHHRTPRRAARRRR